MRTPALDRLIAAGALLCVTGCMDSVGIGSNQSVFPEAWGGTTGQGFYVIGVEPNPRTGSGAAFIRAFQRDPGGFASLTQAVRADDYRGKRVRWSAWVRHQDVESAGAWLRVDGYIAMLAFDNMTPRQITGSSDWHQVSVVLDVDQSAVGLTFGVLLAGNGNISVDDMVLEVVGTDVPETDLLTEPSGGRDSALTANAYASARRSPINLDLEGVPPLDAAAVAWLTANSTTLATTDPLAALDDLAPLGEMIGSARIVGLGEGTHGTREFFRMKHRIFRYLVEQQGFTHFAIEASWPEAEKINHYVLTGEGTPATLIRGMYFWTWDTYEVLDLVNWMRQWNTTAPPDKRVRFQGFDMQSPGMAIDTLIQFVNRISPAKATFVAQQIDCIARYRNNLTAWPRDPRIYTNQSSAAKQACRDSLAVVHKLLSDSGSVWTQASSEEQFALGLQSVRAVQQFEEMTAQVGSSGIVAARDKAMAENVSWLLSRAGPTARMVLWAHNFHVARTSITMGAHLATAHGASYLNLGFVFGSGSFLAVNPSFAQFRLESFVTTLIPKGSLEAYFGATGRPNALLDARRLSAAGAPSALRQLPMRAIGAVFNPMQESAYVETTLFPEELDLMIYVGVAEASRRLP